MHYLRFKYVKVL